MAERLMQPSEMEVECGACYLQLQVVVPMDIQQDNECEAKAEAKPAWSFLATQVVSLINLVATRLSTCPEPTNVLVETCHGDIGLHHSAVEHTKASRTAAK